MQIVRIHFPGTEKIHHLLVFHYIALSTPLQQARFSGVQSWACLDYTKSNLILLPSSVTGPSIVNDVKKKSDSFPEQTAENTWTVSTVT